jgi:cytochrome P450
MAYAVPLHVSDFYVGDPAPYYRRLRNEAPVYWNEERGWWALTKWHDIRFVSVHPELFCSSQGIMIPEEGNEQTQRQTDSLIFTDPPRHRRLRAVVKRSFMPVNLRRLEPRIRALVADVVGRLEAGAVLDFAKEVAGPLPTIVIAEMLGAPVEDWPRFRLWTDAVIGFLDPAEPMTAPEAHVAMHAYLTELIDARRRAPADDLTSELVRSTVDGAPLSESELYSFLWLLLVAGNETVRNLIALGTLALLDHPEQLARLTKEPALVPAAVEEMLRWCGVVTYMARTATQDVDIRGTKIRAGQMVMLLYAAANRDEETFGTDAEAFDVARHPNPHLTFGFGEHICLGANLARLQARLLFEELLPWLPRLELAGDVTRVMATMVPGVRHLPIRVV